VNHFSWLYDFFVRDNYDNNQKDEERKDMLNLVLPFVANMLKDIVADKAQSLAVEHLEPHLDKLPKEVREALDGAVDGDNSHGHKSVMDLIKG
jgi:hypothetical protein